MDDFHLLQEVLRYWGFKIAAESLQERETDTALALKAWEFYPKCMDAYPKQLSRRTTK